MHTRHHLPTVAALLVCLSGCAIPGFLKFGKNDFPTASAKRPVVKVVGLWQPSDGVGIDQRACRGFAGQIMFLVEDSPTPALVDGSVRIYVFDDQGGAEEQGKPIHQFDFPAEAWKMHACTNKLGLMYSVFIPYTRKGNHEAHCSVMVRYSPLQGPIAYSEMVNIELPGTKNTKKPAEQGAYDDDDIDSASTSPDRPVGQALHTRINSDEPNWTPPDLEQLAAEVGAFTKRTAPASRASRRLSPDDEERILRETRARLQTELPAAEDDRPSRRSSDRRVLHLKKNPLSEADGAADTDDEGSVAGNSLATKPAARRHILDSGDSGDSEEELEDDAELPLRHPKSSRETRGLGRESARPQRHPLAAEEPHKATSGRRKRPETLTISLSGGN